MSAHVVSCFALLALLQVEAPKTPQAPKNTALAAPVRLECDKGPIDTGANIAHSGPLFADLDGDKKPELLVGNFKGTLQRYDNTGKPDAPRFVDRGLLQAGGEDIKIHNW